jgi:hypothetical protein
VTTAGCEKSDAIGVDSFVVDEVAHSVHEQRRLPRPGSAQDHNRCRDRCPSDEVRVGITLRGSGRHTIEARGHSRLSYARAVEIRIGVANSARELSFETDKPVAEIEKLITEQVAKGDDGVVRLEDQRGHVFIVPVSQLAYVELANERARKVGFAP